MAGEKAPRAFSMEELPGHLIGEVLTSGRLTAGDLARLEATCRALPPLVEHAASRLCAASSLFLASPISTTPRTRAHPTPSPPCPARPSLRLRKPSSAVAAALQAEPCFLPIFAVRAHLSLLRVCFLLVIKRAGTVRRGEEGKKIFCFGRGSLRIKMAPIGCFYYISLLVALSYLTVSTKWVRGERPEDYVPAEDASVDCDNHYDEISGGTYPGHNNGGVSPYVIAFAALAARKKATQMIRLHAEYQKAHSSSNKLIGVLSDERRNEKRNTIGMSEERRQVFGIYSQAKDEPLHWRREFRMRCLRAALRARGDTREESTDVRRREYGRFKKWSQEGAMWEVIVFLVDVPNGSVFQMFRRIC